jgi:hypothetical protein
MFIPSRVDTYDQQLHEDLPHQENPSADVLPSEAERAKPKTFIRRRAFTSTINHLQDSPRLSPIGQPLQGSTGCKEVIALPILVKERLYLAVHLALLSRERVSMYMQISRVQKEEANAQRLKTLQDVLSEVVIMRVNDLVSSLPPISLITVANGLVTGPIQVLPWEDTDQLQDQERAHGHATLQNEEYVTEIVAVKDL